MLRRRETLGCRLVGHGEFTAACLIRAGEHHHHDQCSPHPVVEMLIKILLLIAGALSLALVPWVFKPIDRRTVSWGAAWARTTIIVLYFIAFTVVLPSLVIKSSTVASLPRTAQQFIGAGVWTVALAIGLWGLWWAQRSERV